MTDIQEERTSKDEGYTENPLYALRDGDHTKFNGRSTDFWKDQTEIINLLNETGPERQHVTWESLLVNRYIMWEILKKLERLENAQEAMNKMVKQKEEMYSRKPNKLR